jgi:hypothetical protein
MTQLAAGKMLDEPVEPSMPDRPWDSAIQIDGEPRSWPGNRDKVASPEESAGGKLRISMAQTVVDPCTLTV